MYCTEELLSLVLYFCSSPHISLTVKKNKTTDSSAKGFGAASASERCKSYHKIMPTAKPITLSILLLCPPFPFLLNNYTRQAVDTLELN